ncbi:hypothetical protein GCM10010168_83070 [Actinoplanes ianthinogenes]|uniref:Uncharacterized protein n=1 Tax=Actinoplanes ianthinogenes TaxID=122358 RepID=A0ABN6CPC9_9ACTN|nr:TFIIB-type zinc ribbon-containing protein [Actinoplanes ianthinogenes]BCJ47086.1 hypothetical protein Aiant_77430 [Actinoplanes ianthinogenes]GGR51588.1 hypothetical protein GCM10010168_83070 [Actinoplanes ianthinogenes]
MDNPAARFRDPTWEYTLVALAGQPIDVVCPRCAARARVITPPGAGAPLVAGVDAQVILDAAAAADRLRRLVCSACGYTRTASPPTSSPSRGGPVDPFFRQPLFLTTRVRGHHLWAYHRPHLDLLTRFIAAGLRERGPGGGCVMSLLERLPPWMKSARNRDDLLAALADLGKRLDGSR